MDLIHVMVILTGLIQAPPAAASSYSGLSNKPTGKSPHQLPIAFLPQLALIPVVFSMPQLNLQPIKSLLSWLREEQMLAAYVKRFTKATPFQE